MGQCQMSLMTLIDKCNHVITRYMKAKLCCPAAIRRARGSCSSPA